jgi:hypothetical protein
MPGSGVMEEIRNLLSEGKTSSEVITQGYKPPTVYKVLRQLNRQRQGNSRAPAPGMTLPPTNTTDLPPESGLVTENIKLFQEVENLKGELECFVDAEADLVAETRIIIERLQALESEAAAIIELRQRVKELEGQLEHATHAQAAMHQEAIQWRQKFEREQAARLNAEHKLHKYDNTLFVIVP